MLKSIFVRVVMIAAAVCLATHGEQLLQEVVWTADSAAAAGAAVAWMAAGTVADYPCLQVTSAESGGLRVTLAVIDAPGISTRDYAVRTRVRGDAVEGTAYLEMWNYFGGDEAYFTRTLSSSGPMRTISGNEGWRQAILPFHLRQDSEKPHRLSVSVVLPGKGTVYVGPLTLVEFDPGEDPLRDPGAWWSEVAGGFGGGIAGAVLGLWGAATGILVGRKKARNVVVYGSLTVMIAGLAGVAAGIAALLLGQPYPVFYPLLLLGGLASVLPFALLARIRQQYGRERGSGQR
jgi:hypothetical protein